MYEVRWWNIANECISVSGKYSMAFDTFEDAWDAAKALVKSAVKSGAQEMSINNQFYMILDD